MPPRGARSCSSQRLIVVLPALPVIATTLPSKRDLAAPANFQSPSSVSTTGNRGLSVSKSLRHITAAAPFAIAACTKSWPFRAFSITPNREPGSPERAIKRSPATVVRESMLMPKRSTGNFGRLNMSPISPARHRG